MSEDGNVRSAIKENYYSLPDYEKLIIFPNFKTKLAKKLTIKLGLLRDKKHYTISRLQSRLNDKLLTVYAGYIEAEIALVEALLNNKEINDMIEDENG